MGFYQDHVEPYLVHLSMRQARLAEYRRRVVAEARGRSPVVILHWTRLRDHFSNRGSITCSVARATTIRFASGCAGVNSTLNVSGTIADGTLSSAVEPPEIGRASCRERV